MHIAPRVIIVKLDIAATICEANSRLVEDRSPLKWGSMESLASSTVAILGVHGISIGYILHSTAVARCCISYAV